MDLHTERIFIEFSLQFLPGQFSVRPVDALNQQSRNATVFQYSLQKVKRQIPGMCLTENRSPGLDPSKLTDKYSAPL